MRPAPIERATNLDDDKARRNLVLVSAAILLTGWLGLPLTDIAERVLNIKTAGKIDPFRAWLAVMAVMLYLAYRFTFSPDEQAARDAWYTDWTQQRQAFQRRTLMRHLRRALMSGEDSHLFGNTLLTHFAREANKHGIDRAKGGTMGLAQDAPAVNFQSTWSGNVDGAWQGKTAEGHHQSSSGYLLGYDFRTTRQRLPIYLLAGFVLLFRSKTTSVGVAPAALGLVAMGYAAFQCGSALMT